MLKCQSRNHLNWYLVVIIRLSTGSDMSSVSNNNSWHSYSPSLSRQRKGNSLIVAKLFCIIFLSAKILRLPSTIWHRECQSQRFYWKWLEKLLKTLRLHKWCLDKISLMAFKWIYVHSEQTKSNKQWYKQLSFDFFQ